MFTCADFILMNIIQSNICYDYVEAVDIVNNFYIQDLNIDNYYNYLQNTNNYSVNTLELAEKFHRKFINEMFDG